MPFRNGYFLSTEPELLSILNLRYHHKKSIGVTSGLLEGQFMPPLLEMNFKKNVCLSFYKKELIQTLTKFHLTFINVIVEEIIISIISYLVVTGVRYARHFTYRKGKNLWWSNWEIWQAYPISWKHLITMFLYTVISRGAV